MVPMFSSAWFSSVAQLCPTLCDPMNHRMPGLPNLSYIFSILVFRLFICNSILFSRFWIIFTIIILNSFSGRLPITFSFVWFGGLLSCSFTCLIFLCLFILFKLLCLGWAFCMLEVCGSFLLWRFLPVGVVG